MPESTESPRTMLKRYADTLTANAQAVTEDEKYEIADDLIEITGDIEKHGMEVSKLIYELLEQSTPSV